MGEPKGGDIGRRDGPDGFGEVFLGRGCCERDATVMRGGGEGGDAPEDLEGRTVGCVGDEQGLGSAGWDLEMVGEVAEGDWGVGGGEEGIDECVLRHGGVFAVRRMRGRREKGKGEEEDAEEMQLMRNVRCMSLYFAGGTMVLAGA